MATEQGLGGVEGVTEVRWKVGWIRNWNGNWNPSMNTTNLKQKCATRRLFGSRKLFSLFFTFLLRTPKYLIDSILSVGVSEWFADLIDTR